MCLKYFISLVFISASATIILTSTSYASDGPDWLSGELSVRIVTEHSYGGNDSYEVINNNPCKYVSGKYNYGSVLYPKYSIQIDCGIDGGAGYFASQKVLLSGDTMWQGLEKNNCLARFPNPASPGFIYTTGFGSCGYNPGGHEVFYVNDWRTYYGKINVNNYNGYITRNINSTYSHKLSYPDGSYLTENTTSGISYSKNGRWAYVSTNAGQLRLDIRTFEAFSFAEKYRPYYSTFTAISNSGRFITKSNAYEPFYIYDLEKCEAEKPMLESRNCQKRNIYNLVKSEYIKQAPENSPVVGEFNILSMKFMNESTIELYVYVSPGRQLPGGKYYLLEIKVDPGSQPQKYLALGDSFASGEGAGNYLNTTDFYSADDLYNLCHQSKVSYPYLLSEKLGFDWSGSVTCSGAMMKDIQYNEDYYPRDAQALFSPKSTSPSQQDIELVNRYAKILTPGYSTQQRLIQDNNPSVITLSVGGNDIGFGNIVTACVTQLECYTSRDERERLADQIDAKIPELTRLYKSLREDMSGDKRLYVVGYPRIIGNDSSCASVFSPHERSFAESLIAYLNEAISVAAQRAGVRYVDVSNSFIDPSVGGKDYRLCGDAKIKAVNGLTFSTSVSARQPLDKRMSESYHPNALGHQMLDRQIRAMTNDLQLAMPKAIDESASLQDAARVILVGDSEDKVNQKTLYDPDLVVQKAYELDQKAKIDVDYQLDVRTSLPSKDGKARFEIHSEIVKFIDELDIDANGKIIGQLTIPDGAPSGMHELHMYYTDINGSTVDTYSYVYLAGNLNDYDSDGVLNELDKCPMSGGIGIDEDQDAVDDFCDNSVEQFIAVGGTIPDTEANLDPATNSGDVRTLGVMMNSISGSVTSSIYTPLPLQRTEVFDIDSQSTSKLNADMNQTENTEKPDGLEQKVDIKKSNLTADNISWVIPPALMGAALIGTVLYIVWRKR